MPDPFITREQLETRVSPTAVERVLDDFNEGGADSGAVDRVLADACSFVRSRLGFVFDLTALPLATADELVRIALDVAHGYLAQRHPEVLRIDGYKLIAQAGLDLKAIRVVEHSVSTTTPPEPGFRHQAIVYDSGQRVFLDGTNRERNSGDF